VDAALFAALAEPNRLRIVEQLHEHPCAVGEVAAKLGLRQPQATKHLHRLARAGLVTVRPDAQRRIYALERERLRALRSWLDGFDAEHPSEDALSLARRFPVPPALLWRYWTSADLVREWWAPEGLVVADCEVDAVPGGRLRIVVEEGDGSSHTASGRFLTLAEPRRLSFVLAPRGSQAEPLIEAKHGLVLRETADGTDLSIDIRIAASTVAPAIVGMGLAWEQRLTKLARAVARSSQPTS
jgi:uncharacterized protein YndB with AHSA1/START domain